MYLYTQYVVNTFIYSIYLSVDIFNIFVFACNHIYMIYMYTVNFILFYQCSVSMSSQRIFATFFRQTHWTEKPVADMTTRDWRIFREAHPVAKGGTSNGFVCQISYLQNALSLMQKADESIRGFPNLHPRWTRVGVPQ